MTPQQREAAMRLADVMDRCPMGAVDHEAAALLRELLAEQRGEPVARIRVWWKPSHDGTMQCHAELTDFENCIDQLPEGEHLLYTHPPQQRKPLTDYELDRFWMNRPNLHDCELLPQLHDFARAIERAHGIGEKP